MKRIFFAIFFLTVGAPLAGRSQDAATEERLKQLSGRIEDLIAGQEAQRKQISNLAREIESLREQQSHPNTTYAAQEDLKHLADAIKNVDQKRIDDNEKIGATLDKIKKSLEASLRTPKASGSSTEQRERTPGTSNKSDKPEKGFGEYTIQPGDTISAVIAAYKDKGIKLTEKQIMGANPGLVPEKMKVGQKIWIPAPDK
jgi:LysM repeat protein